MKFNELIRLFHNDPNQKSKQIKAYPQLSCEAKIFLITRIVESFLPQDTLKILSQSGGNKKWVGATNFSNQKIIVMETKKNQVKKINL
jgi:hypothetical protein